MVMMIKEVIEHYGLKVNNNIINLGWANGWGLIMTGVYNTLKGFIIEGTNDNRTVGRCETEYTFQITDGVETYTVVYKVDSGD